MSYMSTWYVYIDFETPDKIPSNIDDFAESCVRAIYYLGYNGSVSCDAEKKDTSHWSYVEEDFYYRLTFEWGEDDEVGSIESYIESMIEMTQPLFHFKNFEIRFLT